MIIKEKINEICTPIVAYTANNGDVYAVAVNEPNNVLFAGGENFYRGQIVQYELSTGKVLKNYDQVGIGSIWSSTVIGNMWIFAGYKSSKFVVIDSVTKQVFHKPVTTAIDSIYYMTIGKVKHNRHDSKLLLFIVGDDPDFSESKTDVFDITRLANKYSSVLKNKKHFQSTILDQRIFQDELSSSSSVE